MELPGSWTHGSIENCKYCIKARLKQAGIHCNYKVRPLPLQNTVSEVQFHVAPKYDNMTYEKHRKRTSESSGEQGHSYALQLVLEQVHVNLCEGKAIDNSILFPRVIFDAVEYRTPVLCHKLW